MIYIDPKDLILLEAILRKYPYTYYAYGSRVKNTHKKFSDLDLCIMENPTLLELGNLDEELEESDITIKIDVKRWHQDMSDDFRSLIKNDLVLLKIPQTSKNKDD